MPSTENPVDHRSAIVAAAAGLLRDGGASAVTTRAVAQTAQVPPPTIYRLFGDKNGLLEAVAEHIVAGYVEHTSRQATETDDPDPVTALRDAWHAQIDFGLQHPDVFRLLIEPGRPQRSVAAHTGRQVLRTRIDRVAAAGLLTVPAARAVGLIHAAGTGAVLTLLSQPVEHRDPGLADGLLDGVLRVILTTVPAPPATDPVAVINALHATLPDLGALSAAERALLSEWLDRSITHLERLRR